MTRRAAVLIAAAALGAAQPALADSWRVVATGGAQPNRVVYLVDIDTVVSDGGDKVNFLSATVWESVTETRNSDMSVTQREGNCATMSSRILGNSFFLQGRPNGVSNTAGQMVVHGEQTIMRGVLSAACTGEGYLSEEIGNADYESFVRGWFARTAQ